MMVVGFLVAEKVVGDDIMLVLVFLLAQSQKIKMLADNAMRLGCQLAEHSTLLRASTTMNVWSLRMSSNPSIIGLLNWLLCTRVVKKEVVSFISEKLLARGLYVYVIKKVWLLRTFTAP